MNTRERLLTAAETVARQRGYDGFSFADLADAVGIRKASIHYHFPTKAEMATALIDRYRQRLAVVRQGLQTATAGEAILAMIKVYRGAMGEGDQFCLCVALSTGRDRLPEAAQASLEAYHSETVSWLAARFGQAVKDGTIQGVGDPDSEAAALLALMEGAQILARATSDLARFDVATRQFRDRLIVADHLTQ